MNTDNKEYVPQIAKGYTCKLCGTNVSEGEFHDCELDDPLKWGQIPGGDKPMSKDEVISELLQRISRYAKMIDEKQQRIVQLEQERKQIASDAWRAAVTWEHWHYYEEIYGKLMPKDMRNNRPPQLHEYLSRFEQTKAENI